MTIKLKICGRELDLKTNYKTYKDERSDNFFIKEKKEEVSVKKVDKRKSSRMLKIKTLSILGLAVVATPRMTYANSVTAETTREETLDWLTPQAMLDFGINVGTTGLIASFAVAMGTLTCAGILKMFGKKKFAIEWTSNIWNGLGHCIAVIPSVFAIYYLATSLFGQLNFLDVGSLNIP